MRKLFLVSLTMLAGLAACAALLAADKPADDAVQSSQKDKQGNSTRIERTFSVKGDR